jgi:branched-chain amino acid transport system substrate-binding protein
MLQVSPASTAIDLVRPFLGSTRLPPEEGASDERNFGRVIPDDDAQGRAAAGWVRDLGVRRIGIAPPTGPGRVLADAFRRALPADVSVTRARPRLLYDAVPAHGEPGSPTGSFQGRIMASDAFLPPFSTGRHPAADLITSSAQDPSQLPAAGQRFVREFRGRYARRPGRYAAYGYEAMALILDSIRRAENRGDERQAVIDAFFTTAERDSILGRYSIDSVGNTTLDRLAGYRVRDGRVVFDRVLSAVGS